VDTTFVATQVLGEAGIQALRQLLEPKNQSGPYKAVAFDVLRKALSLSGYGNVDARSLGLQLHHLGYASWCDTGNAQDLWGLVITPEGKEFLKEWDAQTQ
jgi:hypothetical protein